MTDQDQLDALAEPCPICGPRGHGRHEDDSYGACVLCREYVPHTDDETVLVAFPCAVVREHAAARERDELRAALEPFASAFDRDRMPVTAKRDYQRASAALHSKDGASDD